ncbi:MAG TPA: zf-HC2 domain-containing protein [Gemmatimonadaceae bacterium]|nr:zf-HC2 domain-containing protein [Gemmatimonadaceae bacterium]
MTDRPGDMDDCWQRDERIDAYVDGTISDIERRELEAHLRTCARCRDEEASIRALVTRARKLPREFSPSADRWSEVRARTRKAPRPLVSWRLARLAAAVLVVAALSSAVTVMVMRDGATDTRTIAVGPTAPAASVALVDQQYGDVTRELAAELDARRGELSPEAIATVERNLAVIDAALAEARSALQSEPDNLMLARMLAATYERKLDLLRQATRLSPSS